MNYLGKKPKSIFLGQAVEVAGTAMSNTLKEVPKNKLYEFPVTEEMQMGVTIGLLMQDFVPISIYPRWNFLILAANQLINHLDKLNEMTKNQYKSKAIIRTSVGSEYPLHLIVTVISAKHLKVFPNIEKYKFEKARNDFS